jgi:hypothetical protein
MTTTFSCAPQTNDLFIGSDGNLSISTQLQAVLYACQNAMQLVLGEAIYQTNEGLPNFQLIWGGVPNIPQWRAAAYVTLQNVSGVQEVISLTAAQMGGRLVYNATILTLYGTGTFNGQL